MTNDGDVKRGIYCKLGGDDRVLVYIMVKQTRRRRVAVGDAADADATGWRQNNLRFTVVARPADHHHLTRLQTTPLPRQRPTSEASAPRLPEAANGLTSVISRDASVRTNVIVS